MYTYIWSTYIYLYICIQHTFSTTMTLLLKGVCSTPCNNRCVEEGRYRLVSWNVSKHVHMVRNWTLLFHLWVFMEFEHTHTDTHTQIHTDPPAYPSTNSTPTNTHTLTDAHTSIPTPTPQHAYPVTHTHTQAPVASSV